MIKKVAHVGFSVSNLDNSIAFYRDILQMVCVGYLEMKGPTTDALFGKSNTETRIAYMKKTKESNDPPIELIEIIHPDITHCPTDLFRTSISEFCFEVDDMDEFYKHLIDNHVDVLSAPQFYDFTQFDMGLAKAIYFRDPDGIILEAIEEI